MFDGKRVLITGATGFVGRALARRLKDGGAEVVALGRRGSRLDGVRDFVLDRWRAEDIRGALGPRPFDVVFHLAAAGVAPGDCAFDRLFEVNVALGCALLAATRAEAYVFAGSCAEYARRGRQPLIESDPLEIERPYGASKAAGGIAHCACARALGKRLAVLRLFHVYGPGEQPHRLTSALLSALSRGRRARLTDGEQIRDFLYLDDALEAFLLAARCLLAGDLPTGPYNVSTGAGVSVGDACRAMARLIGAPEDLLGFGDMAMRADEQPFVVGDSSRFRAATGWRPRYTWEEGLAALLEAVRDREPATP